MAIKKFYIALLSILLLSSCGEYNRLIKSSDYDMRFSKAKEFYEKGKYLNAVTLLEPVVTAFKGTEKGEEALYLMAMSHFKNEDNLTARSYFAGYFRSYPRGKYAEECKFHVGECYYLESPEAKLDQEFTNKAIEEFTAFMELYPKSEYIPQATKMLEEMKDKLAYKAYLNAKLYHKLGNYQGNNYKSAVIAARNAIKEYPGSKYEEELMFLILKSKFLEAEESIASKQEERYRDTVDEYYAFTNYYPNSKYKKEAFNIFEKSSKHFK
ncbi:MAG: outer membrane protein assembly factor BamD [Paludibacteraceae bacterium]|mgnify:FL=1|nr:outer membrane protein assembly factor BamD [Paludibacteraceae bacterium]HOU68382.1 outer membrane protein assembly factor BamD [Paludibacteraceae bacterium]HQJ90173.1 outer membrane protein assembly factor BamD [Paludibacteraceae bacterium]